MLKRARVYICDHCGAIALEQNNFFVHDTWKSPPEGWRKLGNEDLCPLCAATYRRFKEETIKEKNEHAET